MSTLYCYFIKKYIDYTILFKFLLLTFIATCVSTSYAQWVFVDKITSDEPIAFYLDKKTIKSSVEQRNKIARANALSDYLLPQNVNGTIHKSRIFQREYNCTTMSFRDLGVSVYSENMGKGRLVFSEKDPQLWDKVTPNSPMEKEISMACGSEKIASSGQLSCAIPSVGKINVKYNRNTNEVIHEGAQQTYDRVVTDNKLTYSLPSTNGLIRFDINLESKIIEVRLMVDNQVMDMKKGSCT